MDLYETLGVSAAASAEEVKAAYRRRAQATHPDKEGGSEDEFKRVGKAYEVLSNPAQRTRYDQTGATDAQPTVEEEAASVLRSVFEQYLDSDSPDQPILSMRKAVGDTMKRQKDALDSAKRTAKRLNLFVGKLKPKSGGRGPSLLKVLEVKVAQATAAVRDAERTLEVCADVLKLLDGWECDSVELSNPHTQQRYGLDQALDQIRAQYINSRGDTYGRRR